MRGSGRMLEDIIKVWRGKEVDSMYVYRDIFHLGEHDLQKEGECKGKYKTNPIGLGQRDGKFFRRIMFEDTFEKSLKELQEADFAILNGLTYFGRRNIMANASKMYAMIFDIDGVTDKTLNAFFSGAFNAEVYPIPNYVVLSGHGIHLYYIFEEPISLYPNIKIQLKELKYALTGIMWNRYTSQLWENVQYQGINQGFRVIGGKTKIDGYKVKAFQVNEHPFTINQLNKYVSLENRIDESKLFKESKMTLEKAKEVYPEWYERRVLQHQDKGKWICKRDLYNWWLQKIKENASFGHRYFCIMCLAIYGIKCGVEYEEIKQDALKLISRFNQLNPDEPFTESDCLSALECYDERYITFPIKDISKISGIVIQKNKRNGRKQDIHLMGARAIQEINDKMNGTNWRKGNGRPSKKKIVEEYLKNHLTATKTEIIREIGLSKTTVYKYYDKVKLEIQIRNVEIKKLKEELEIWKIKLSKILLKNQDDENVRNDRKYTRHEIWRLGIELQKLEK